MEKTIAEFTSVKALVDELMSADERCRNDDKWLTYCILQHIACEHGQKVFIPFKLFRQFPSYETITRVRRVIQHKEKRLLPTSVEVQIKRKLREWVIRNIIHEV